MSPCIEAGCRWRATGTGREVQLIAANIDTVFVVTSCNADFNVARLVRHVALAFEAGIEPVIVLTKADLTEDSVPNVDAAQAASERVPVLALDARGAAPAQALPTRNSTSTGSRCAPAGTPIATAILSAPLQALHIKKQIVLYGPPGTGKTYQARQLAASLIRQDLLKLWGPRRYFSTGGEIDALIIDRTHRVQFHPGYGYEDFVRGLQIGSSGQTEYRDGVLLRLVEALKAETEEDRRIPTILILDEMNRADLSKVLGECFSVLEDRDSDVTLGGHDSQLRKIRLPHNLYVIGTMNLIDQSLESVDFALRRRFLWFFRGFSREDFVAVSKYRWDALIESGAIRQDWWKIEAEFDVLAERAERLNALIDGNSYLGPQYQIGHTYFCDVVSFVHRYLIASETRRNCVLFNGRGGALDPVLALWRYSLDPLMNQYRCGRTRCADETRRGCPSCRRGRVIGQADGGSLIVAQDCSPIPTSSREDDDWLRRLVIAAKPADLLLQIGPRGDEPDDEPIATFESISGAWWAGRYIGEIQFEGRTLRLEPRFGMPALIRWLTAIWGVRLVDSKGKFEQQRIWLWVVIAHLWSGNLIAAAKHSAPFRRVDTIYEGRALRGKLSARETALARSVGDDRP